MISGRHSPIRHTPPVTINPSRQVSYARNNPVPAAIWLLVILIGLVIVKNGTLPSASQTLTWTIATVIVIASATIAPELVTALLLAALVLALLTNVPLVSDLIDRLDGHLGELTSGLPTVRLPGGIG